MALRAALGSFTDLSVNFACRYRSAEETLHAACVWKQYLIFRFWSKVLLASLIDLRNNLAPRSKTSVARQDPGKLGLHDLGLLTPESHDQLQRASS